LMEIAVFCVMFGLSSAAGTNVYSISQRAARADIAYKER